MAIDSNVLQEVVDALKQDPEIKNNVYQATVSKIDNEGVVWVNIAGSDTETPTAITSAEVAPGDAVNVEWRNNKLYIGGNYSNPSAGVARVANVEQIADVAVAQAARAQTAAANAETYAEDAKATANSVRSIAEQASADAETANGAAQNALAGLSTVESVVNVVNWVMKPENVTTDETVDPNKTYYIYDAGTGTLSVAEPQAGDNPSALGWYEIDEAIANYVSKHLTLTDEGLSLISDNSSTRTLITNGYYVKTQDQAIDVDKTYYELVGGEYVEVQSPDVSDIDSYYELARRGGVYLINNNKDVAYYGEETQIGDSQSFNLKITSTELGFYQADRRVAYLNNNTLYITQSVVVNEMQVGELNNRPEWTWKYDKSDRSLYLKWIGA